jgi:excisionase family DNA binding protein
MKRKEANRSFMEPMRTVAEIAEETNSSERSVRRWIANGELEVIRFGRSVRIEHSAFLAFLRSKRN